MTVHEPVGTMPDLTYTEHVHVNVLRHSTLAKRQKEHTFERIYTEKKHTCIYTVHVQPQ